MEPRHRTLAVVLITLSAVIGFFAMFAVWAKRQALETDTWVHTSTKLLDNKDVQVALSAYLVDSLYNSVNVEGELKKQLPPQAQALAGPASGALRELANKLALEALQRPQVQALWEDANRTAHKELLAIVDGGKGNISTDNGEVVLHLKPIVEALGARVGVNAADKIPDSVSSLVIMRSDQLGAAQDGVHILKTLAWLLTALALGLAAIAIFIARGWRREAVRMFGWSFVAIGIAVLFVRGAAGNIVVGQLATTSSAEPAAHAVWSIGTSLLYASAVAMIGYGLAVILGAWLAAPGPVATSARRGITPLLQRRSVGYTILAAIVLLLLWWDPTPGTGRLGPTLILIALLVAGYEALRAIAVREFPDQTWEAGTAHWREVGTRIVTRSGRGSETGAAATAEGADGPVGSRLAQLQQLKALHDSDALTDAEFAEQKTKVLADDWAG